METPELLNGKDHNGYQIIYYNVDVDYHPNRERLEKITNERAALTKEKDKLVKEAMQTVETPTGWKREIDQVDDYGRLKVRIYHDVWKQEVAPTKKAEDSPKPATEADKLRERINAVLHYVDARTLFHSNVLSKEEKRVLLGFENQVSEAKAGNSKEKLIDHLKKMCEMAMCASFNDSGYDQSDIDEALATIALVEAK